MKNFVKRGSLFVISGPSGVGKGTLVQLLIKNNQDITVSVSATTRNPRPGEIDGVHYFFLEKDEFLMRIEQGEFLEWAEFAGNFYGTNSKLVDNMLEKGQNIILEIDVCGALQVKNKINEAILIFIEPPSVDELKNRLFKRHTESESEIQKRIAIVQSEFEKKQKFNHVIVNDNLDNSYKNLESIILKEIHRVNN